MTDYLQLAISNNIWWCNTVTLAHGFSGENTGALWVNIKNTLPFYPNIITQKRLANNPEDLEKLYSILAENKSVSIKDSFGELDLTHLKYRKIVDAEWIGYQIPLHAHGDSDWKRLNSQSSIANWIRVWNKKTSVPQGQEIFMPSLLKKDEIWFCSWDEGKSISGGAILYVFENTVGISNVFSGDKITEFFWKNLLNYVATHFPGYIAVGYESSEELQTAVAAGFKPLGPLYVWKKEI